MRISRGALWALCCVLVMGLFVVEAAARQSPAVRRARARAKKAARSLALGIKYYESARFKRSLRTLRKALRLARVNPVRARIYLYMGLNQGVLGRKGKAVEAFREALLANPRTSLDPARFKPGDIALLEQAKRALSGNLVVQAENGEGALVLVDGKARGKVPLRLSLPVGKHDVVVRRGGDVQRREVVVGHGATVRVDVTFEVAAVKPPKPVDPPPTRTPIAKGEGDGPSAWGISRPRLWTWITLGVAAAAGGAALGTGLWAQSEAEEYRTTNDPTQLDPLRDSAESKMLMANIFAGVAGAALITAVILYYVEGRPSAGEREQAALRSWDVALGPGSAQLRLSF